MKELELQVVNELIDFFNYYLNNTSASDIGDLSERLYMKYLNSDQLLSEHVVEIINMLFHFKQRDLPSHFTVHIPTYLDVKNDILPFLNKHRTSLLLIKN